MRLLNVHTTRLHTFYGNSIPSYAILSHTWLADNEEVTFAHLHSEEASDWDQLPGAKKLKFTCQQADDDGHSWAWIDTCCIDKTNNAELSEAINSMFRWYQQSEVCYAFLADFESHRHQDPFLSRWWTRAWTLQELVAPEHVQFFDGQWRPMGTKSSLANEIASRMRIDVETLHDPKDMHSKSVAQKMSWAANRQATREEDLAYSLLGIFNINITMQYGEGQRAFVRLQEEIMRSTVDMSIFAWGFDPHPLKDVCGSHLDNSPDFNTINRSQTPGYVSLHGLYADSPKRFSHTQDVINLAHYIGDVGSEVQHGVQSLRTMLVPLQNRSHSQARESGWQNWSLALLPCILPSAPHHLVGILFRRWEDGHSHSIRHSFKHDVYSCLVRSEYISNAIQGTMKISTWESQQLQKKADSNNLRRTLTVRLEDMKDCSFQMLQAHWQPDPYDPHRFTMLDGPEQFHTILCFQNRGASVSIYVGYTTSATVGYKPQAPISYAHMCVIRAMPISTPTELAIKKIYDALMGPNTAESMIPRACVRTSCRHDRIGVTARTKIVFNQALTVVTLSLQWQDLGAVCIKRKEWRGS